MGQTDGTEYGGTRHQPPDGYMLAKNTDTIAADFLYWASLGQRWRNVVPGMVGRPAGVYPAYPMARPAMKYPGIAAGRSGKA